MNTISTLTRRLFFSFNTLLHHPTTTPVPFSTQSSRLSNLKDPKTKWSLQKPKNRNHRPKWTPPLPVVPSAPPPQNPNTPNLFNPNEFSILCNLLQDPSVHPGPPLEAALDQTGIKPDEPLLLAILGHFDSSPKPLFTLFLWAEKQAEFRSSTTLFNSMVNALGKAREFDSAWGIILDRINDVGTRPNLDTFSILIRRYTRAGYAEIVTLNLKH